MPPDLTGKVSPCPLQLAMQAEAFIPESEHQQIGCGLRPKLMQQVGRSQRRDFTRQKAERQSRRTAQALQAVDEDGGVLWQCVDKGQSRIEMRLRRCFRVRRIRHILEFKEQVAFGRERRATVGQLAPFDADEVCRLPLRDMLARFILATDAHPAWPAMRMTGGMFYWRVEHPSPLFVAC